MILRRECSEMHHIQQLMTVGSQENQWNLKVIISIIDNIINVIVVAIVMIMIISATVNIIILIILIIIITILGIIKVGVFLIMNFIK